jgi:hypothetical protein
MKVKQIQSEEKAFIKFLENKGVARSIVFGQRPYMRDEKFSEGDVMEAAILDKDLSIIYSEAPAFVRGEFTKAFTKALKTHKCDKSRMNTNTNFEELISSLTVSSSLEHMSTYQTFSLDGGLKDKIKKFRQSGLESGGEYSYENLTFKLLRRNGYIEKLLNVKNIVRNKKLSLPQ